MIQHLMSPYVCVVDDEASESGPIVAALNGLNVGCVHFTGAIDDLPNEPFDRLRLVFLDLHLSGSVGKDAASYTANVFIKLVSQNTAPLVVVIWSKYASDIVDTAAPSDEQETEADLFVETLLNAEEKFRGRLVFVQMAKPKSGDRPDDWSEQLKSEIGKSLSDQPAIAALWAWDTIVKDACARLSCEISNIAQAAGSDRDFPLALKSTLQKLTRAMGEQELTEESAAIYLNAVLVQLLADQIEHTPRLSEFEAHRVWLAEAASPPPPVNFASKMNTLLLAADPISGNKFSPGTVYRILQESSFGDAFGKSTTELKSNANGKASALEEWKAAVTPVLLEISPVCDVAQGKRINATLIAGLLVPATYISQLKKAESSTKFGPFLMRWPMSGLPEQDSYLVFMHQYRLCVPCHRLQGWLEQWFRLRELPTTAIRNANAANASRIGYVSVAP